MAGGGKCYIYGSRHITLPTNIERWLEKVDVVLLEGIDFSSYKLLAKKDPTILPVILSLRFFFFCIDAITWLRGLWYKLTLGVDFKGDMPYVFELAKKYGERVEVADASILEIYEKKREAFAKSFKRFALALIGLPALLITLVVAIFAVGLLLRGFPPSLSLLFKALFLTLIALSNPLLHVPIVVSSVLAPIALCRETFMREANNIRDSKVVERVCELVAKRYNVLVVRGKQHVKFIAQELQKRRVPYEIVHRGRLP
jgi:hypothetical protein